MDIPRLDRVVFFLVQARLWIGNPRLVKRCYEYNRCLPNIANPRTYVELMLWRKTVDRNPQFVVFGDKLATKDYLAKLCPELPLAKTLWVGMHEEEIPAELFQTGETWFKANHGSSYNLRCAPGNPDFALMAKKRRKWMKADYAAKRGEWHYRLVKPTLFLEESIAYDDQPLIEFQIRASDGVPLVGTCTGETKTPKQWHYYLDALGNLLDDIYVPESVDVSEVTTIEKVIGPYLQAVEWAKILSRGSDYVRCDFFWNGKTLYGGELTLFPNGGCHQMSIKAVDCLLIEGWDLRVTPFLTTPQRGWRKWYAAALRRSLDQARATS